MKSNTLYNFIRDAVVTVPEVVPHLTGRARWMALTMKGNPYHEPAGSEIGGQFADAPGGSGGSGGSGNKLETQAQLEQEKEGLLNKGQGVHSAIVQGKELRNGNLLSINKKLYKVTSTTSSNKFEVREVTSINMDRLFATGGNDNFLNLDYEGEYLRVNEKEMVNFFKPLPK